MNIAFIKMHGLGNDFVIIDLRRNNLTMTPDLIKHIADRKAGIGCDQVIAIAPPALNDKQDLVQATIFFWNSDGSIATACGNGTRCVGALLMAGEQCNELRLACGGRILKVWTASNSQVSVDMGCPKLDWTDIPLARAMDSLAVDYKPQFSLPLLMANPVAVNVGNPHLIFFCHDIALLPLADFAGAIETDPLFPKGINVSFAKINPDKTISLRTWERGAGLTMACGTGACATLVAAARLGLTDRKTQIIMPGGDLTIEWQADDHIIMTGTAIVSFTGRLPIPESINI